MLNFLRKIIDSDVSPGIRQSRRLDDLRLRSTPIREVEMHQFPFKKLIDSDVSAGVWQSPLSVSVSVCLFGQVCLSVCLPVCLHLSVCLWRQEWEAARAFRIKTKTQPERGWEQNATETPTADVTK